MVPYLFINLWIRFRALFGEGPTELYSVIYTMHRGKYTADIFRARNADGEGVVLKCAVLDYAQEDFTQEYRFMDFLKSESWSVRPIEFYQNNINQLCIAMEELGTDFRLRRKVHPYGIPVATVASIGIQLFGILKELHLRHNLVHRDLHSGNMARDLRLRAHGLEYKIRPIDGFTKSHKEFGVVDGPTGMG